MKKCPILFSQSEDDKFVGFSVSFWQNINSFKKSESYRLNNESLSNTTFNNQDKTINNSSDLYIYKGPHADCYGFDNKHFNGETNLYSRWLFNSRSQGSSTGIIGEWMNK